MTATEPTPSIDLSILNNAYDLFVALAQGYATEARAILERSELRALEPIARSVRGDIQRSVTDRVDELKKHLARYGDTQTNLRQTANNFRAALALVSTMSVDDLTTLQRVVLAQRLTEIRAAVEAYTPRTLPPLPDIREPLINAAQSILRDRTRQDGLLRMGDPLAKTINSEVRNMATRVTAANPLGRIAGGGGAIDEIGTQALTALTMFGGLLRDRHHKNVEQFRDLVAAVASTSAYHRAEAANAAAARAQEFAETCANLAARIEAVREPAVTLDDGLSR